MGRGATPKLTRLAPRSQPGPRRRSRRIRRRVGVGLVAAFLVAAAAAGYRWWTAGPSELAPAFALPASTGQTVRLEDYRGQQPVVLLFYMVGT